MTRTNNLTKAAILLIALMSLFSSTAQAVTIPVGSHTFDSSMGPADILSFDGTSFVTPGSVPIIPFTVRVDNNLSLIQSYPGASFVITSGFAATNTIVLDTNFNAIIDAGESITTFIGAGTFEIQSPLGVILYGSFNAGQFNTTVGATSGAGFSADVNGLDLTPGPAFTFDSPNYVAAIDDPEGFGFSLSNIPTGIGVSGAVLVSPPNPPFVPGIFTATLNPFTSSTGSVTASGQITVVPEPSSAMIGLMGMVGLVGIVLWNVKRSGR